jgi:hypothetical protein
MARGIDNINAVIFPVAGSCCGGNSDTALALLLHPVHYGRSVIDITYLIGAPGMEKNRSVVVVSTGIDMRDNPMFLTFSSG